MSKRLVAYFSASGVTAKVAENLADAIGADIFEIQPEVPYTKADLNWMDKKSRSTIEMSDPTSRPAIAAKRDNMDEYDTIHKIRRDFSLLVYDNHITDTKWTATEILRSMLFQPFPNHLWCVRCKQLGKIRLLIILYDHLKMMFRQILI